METLKIDRNTSDKTITEFINKWGRAGLDADNIRLVSEDPLFVGQNILGFEVKQS